MGLCHETQAAGTWSLPFALGLSRPRPSQAAAAQLSLLSSPKGCGQHPHWPTVAGHQPCTTTSPWTFTATCAVESGSLPHFYRSLLAKTPPLVKRGSQIGSQDPALLCLSVPPRPPTCRSASLQVSMLGEGHWGLTQHLTFFCPCEQKRPREVWSCLPSSLSQAGLLGGLLLDSAGLRGSTKRPDPLSVPLFPDG